VQAGERVVVLAGRRPEWLAVVLGALNGGAVAVPYPSGAPVDELQELVRHSGAAHVVADDVAESGLDGLSGAPVLGLGEAAGLLGNQPTTAPTFDTGAADTALLLYGRDGDGSLRAAAHTHGSCLAQLDADEHWLGAEPGARLWCSGEPGGPESVWVALAAWGRATELIVHEGHPGPEEAAQLVDLLRIELLWLSAAEYAGLAGVERPRWVDPPRIRTAVLTGGALTQAAADAFAATYGAKIRRGTLRPEAGIVGGDLRGTGDTAGALTGALPGREPVILDRRGREAAAKAPPRGGIAQARAGAPNGRAARARRTGAAAQASAGTRTRGCQAPARAREVRTRTPQGREQARKAEERKLAEQRRDEAERARAEAGTRTRGGRSPARGGAARRRRATPPPPRNGAGARRRSHLTTRSRTPRSSTGSARTPRRRRVTVPARSVRVLAP
jgi:acyl-coenzyme A synthetase/AMP-(fatty) acid ligase